MLAHDRVGSGPPLLLLHGTTSSRQVWAPLLPALAEASEVIAVDLPGHGASAPTSFTPPEWAFELAGFLDDLGLDRVAVVGHSAGGWTALELAKAGRASAVVALTPAGLWRKRSPLLTDLALNANWRLGRAAPRLSLRALESQTVRAVALRSISARPRQLAAEVAVANARAAIGTDSFPRHFAATRRLRFSGGRGIDVPVTVVWGAKDRIALAGKSRNTDELPPTTRVETWAECGHMVMWDAPERLVEIVRTAARPDTPHPGLS